MRQMGEGFDDDMNVSGRCVDMGQTLIEAHDLAELLDLAHNPPDPDTVGRPPTREESANLDDAANHLFLQLTAEEQALYLSRVSAEDAAADLRRLTPPRREIVLKLLPQVQRQAVAHHRDLEGSVLSA